MHQLSDSKVLTFNSMLRSSAILSPVHPAATSDKHRLRLISGTAHLQLAQDVAQLLGVSLTPVLCQRFADGELYAHIQESIRGCDVFLIQPTCNPVNDSLMELMILIDACRRASARQITVVIPYYGYARADRTSAGREAITAKLVANLMTQAGIDRVLSLDLHSAQVQSFFDVPLDHLHGTPILVNYIRSKQLRDVVIVSPDIGGVARARAFAKRLNDAPLAIVDKRRPAHNQVEGMNVIGDVQDKTVILVDDMIDTAGTICEAARILRLAGARQIYVCATHALLSSPAVERLLASGLQKVIVTNTLPIAEENHFPQLKVLSIANLLGEAILRIYAEKSVSSLMI